MIAQIVYNTSLIAWINKVTSFVLYSWHNNAHISGCTEKLVVVLILSRNFALIARRVERWARFTLMTVKSVFWWRWTFYWNSKKRTTWALLTLTRYTTVKILSLLQIMIWSFMLSVLNWVLFLKLGQEKWLTRSDTFIIVRSMSVSDWTIKLLFIKSVIRSTTRTKVTKYWITCIIYIAEGIINWTLNKL